MNSNLSRTIRKRRLSTSSSSSSSSSESPSSSLFSAHAHLDGQAAPTSSKLVKTDSIDYIDEEHASTSAFGLAAASGLLSCSLPPICSVHPVYFESSTAQESHYHKHHAHVCSLEECRKVFPDEHFLNLHIREFHDPLVAIQQEKGDRTVSIASTDHFTVHTHKPDSTPVSQLPAIASSLPQRSAGCTLSTCINIPKRFVPVI